MSLRRRFFAPPPDRALVVDQFLFVASPDTDVRHRHLAPGKWYGGRLVDPTTGATIWATTLNEREIARIERSITVVRPS